MSSRPDPTADAAIVVVDEDPASLGVSTEILGAAGYSNIRPCLHPRDALEIMENEEIDLLIADLHMPDIDGVSLLANLKKSVPEDGFVDCH